MNNIVPSV